MRGLAVLAAGALLWGVSAGPAAADQDRESQWVLKNYSPAEKVWPISQGEGVIVAVIDTGVNANHPDLAGQVLPGIDFTGSSGDGRTDTNGHGTGMASNIAGHGHGDNAGVIGLAPKAKILPIRIQTDQFTNVNDQSHDAEAIRFAVDHGAKVINMSYSGADPYAKGYKEAIAYAVQKDVVLVAGSGNSPGFPIGYPAGSPGVVAVSGVGEDGEIWSDSTTGPQVTLAAPADNIHSAGLNQEYRTASGTSDAASFVSAIAALVRSKYPSLSAGQVINRLTSSAVQPEGKGPFPNDKYGYGIASPSKALAPNSAVDNGPKENPLLKRAEPNGGTTGASAAPSSPASKPASDGAKSPSAGGGSAAPQASGDSGGKDSNSGMLIAIGGGVVAVIVVVLIVVMVRRSKNGNGGGGSGGSGGSGGPGASGGPGGAGYGYQQGVPQSAGYGYPQGQQQAPGYPPQQGGQPGYPVQPPAGGNPYQS
ncbi:type VII secretion-associated serine protease mycosin [Kitasatospora sp. NA04385]|uniref:type VII secretion-associated serine protease mycosin n=1 Tax=Kitasatospora sp. NA04385 TaxID=2742135 RepID=UPI001591AAD1|nr:type VII secretion-associated serine protease mycosin [Kitasatospora sp. NA04385]QKW19721.1 type VII secretion-associated serine protease mycosin [Kitasatospora sp. NA04385]